MADDTTLAARLLAGDKRALARAISLVEDDDPEGWALVREVYPHTGGAAVVGFTGPPGAGKSTLIGALVRHQRALDRTVAVLSIDPSSPFRGGALLGDRIRLSEHFLDPGVFIRSMATRGALGGLAEAALQAALLMDAAGKDDVFLETVGVGQAEVDVIDHADTVVLVLIPGSGDSIQALKAGVMEIPDIIVVNKSDHPLTDTMVREIRGVLSLAPAESDWAVPIVTTEATRGEGVEELAAKLVEHRAFVEAEGLLGERRRHNLLTRCSGSPRRACAARSRPPCTRTRRSRRCSTTSSPAGSTPRAPRARSSPAARSTRQTPPAAPDSVAVEAQSVGQPPEAEGGPRAEQRRVSTPRAAPTRGQRCSAHATSGTAHGSAGTSAAVGRAREREHGDEQLRAADREADEGGVLGVAALRHGAGDAGAARVPEQPGAAGREREQRRPPEQPGVRVHEQRGEARDPLGVLARAARAGRRAVQRSQRRQPAV